MGMLGNRWFAVVAGVLHAACRSAAAADTFEFFTFTPPPGWAGQDTTDGRVYIGKDANGNASGAVALYASRAGQEAAAAAFTAYWRLYVEKLVPGSPPEPKLGRDGDFAMAVGLRQAEVRGATVFVALTAFSGRGRVFGAMGVANNEAMSSGVMAFFATLRLAAAPAGVPAAAGALELEFDTPPGYRLSREVRGAVLIPLSAERPTPCTYGITPPRESRGSLDADAEAALLEVYPGWQRMDGQRRAMRGVSDTGWPYFWNKADLWQGPSAFSQRGSAMAMAVPAGPGRVQVVWGRGVPLCTLDDVSFVRLFLSLRPRGWASDGGQALARDLLGTWRWTGGASGSDLLQQYTFQPGGRFIRDAGSAVRTGVQERTATSTGGGAYGLRGSELVLTRDGGEPRAYRVRIYEELYAGSWRRVMSLWDERGGSPGTVEYLQVGR